MMTILLVLVSAVLLLASGLMMLVATFRVGILWGIACLLLPPAQLVFIILHWDKARRAVFVWLIGLLILLAAMMTGGETFMTDLKSQLATGLSKQASVSQWQQQVVASLPDDAKQQAQRIGIDTKPAPPVQKVVYKCVDAKKRITYTEQPCEGGQSITITVQD